MGKEPEMSVMFIDDSNNVIGQADYTRWNKLPWYKKLFGYFFYCYKRKFIDMKGFEVSDIDTSKFKAGDVLYLDEDVPGALVSSKATTLEDNLKELNKAFREFINILFTKLRLDKLLNWLSIKHNKLFNN